MALTLQQIIDEANAIVPNEFDVPTQVLWINNINNEFFNVVKIPKIASFTTTKDLATYTMTADVRMKNIDIVMTGLLQYRSLDEDNVVPTQNWYDFDDTTNLLTLNPAPYQNDITGILRYHRIATTTYTSSNLSAVPDAPDEYNWTYVAALCEYICLAMDDPKAASFNAQKTTAWSVAVQNYQSGGAA